MTGRLKLGRMVAGLASSMFVVQQRAVPGIVGGPPMLITESYYYLPECRHSRTRHNSPRESR